MDRGSIHDTLRRYWGYDSFRAKQEEIINSVLLGKDTLGLLPTGGGKSITFQVPAMLLDGLTIVVTPLIALMKDQADGLRDRHINAAYIHSGLRHGEIRNVIDRCVFGKCKFLYISPERLASSSFIESLRRMKVSMIVVDEAHCISQWGYDFRPSYLNIASIRQLFPDAPVLALTASATPAVVADIMQQLQFKEPNVTQFGPEEHHKDLQSGKQGDNHQRRYLQNRATHQRLGTYAIGHGGRRSAHHQRPQ